MIVYDEYKKFIQKLKSLKNVDRTIRNAVKPSYHFHSTCPHCGKEGQTDNGEWLIWCGNKEDAENLINCLKICKEYLDSLDE